MMEDREEECEAAADLRNKAESRAATLQEKLDRRGKKEVAQLQKEVEAWSIKYEAREKDYNQAIKLAVEVQNELREEVRVLKMRIDEGADAETLRLREEVGRLRQELQNKDDQSGPAFREALEMVNAAKAETKRVQVELDEQRARNTEEMRNSGQKMMEIEEEGRRRFEKFVEDEEKKRKAREDEYVEGLKMARRMVDEANAKREEAERTAAVTRKSAQGEVDAPLKLKYELKNQEVEDLKEKVRSMSKKLSNPEHKKQEIRELRENLAAMSEELSNLKRENLALRTDRDGVITVD
ncbi:hypothetical protein GCK72_006987 [Caenorhabditis remanei]|uniref:Uncharacterized protein n=1 Tax=Caenorhabditis remanei TaxID=31234 RepID=A0A6A5HI11_CAERE|nr:hypothetical protein GCK72_006987 [Caenorhabditis remanei]KAF1767029.1 hypothetical protein GCK72_006987 [Caenorhabditis remanei]